MTVEQRDIVEVLREGVKAYADEVGGGHAYRYTMAADEIERLRVALSAAQASLAAVTGRNPEIVSQPNREVSR